MNSMWAIYHPHELILLNILVLYACINMSMIHIYRLWCYPPLNMVVGAYLSTNLLQIPNKYIDS